MVAGYKPGDIPGEEGVKPDKFLYNYAHDAQSSLLEEHGNYDIHTRDGEMIGFVQKNADGVYQPPSTEATVQKSLPADKDFSIDLNLVSGSPAFVEALKTNEDALMKLEEGASLELSYTEKGEEVKNKITKIDGEFYYDSNGDNLAGNIRDFNPDYILNKDAEGKLQATEVERFGYGFGSNNDYGRIAKGADGSINKVFGKKDGGVYSEVKADENGLYSLTDNWGVNTGNFGLGPDGALAEVTGNEKDGFSLGTTAPAKDSLFGDSAYFSNLDKKTGNEYFYGENKALIGVKSSDAKTLSAEAPSLKDTDYVSLAPVVESRMNESIENALDPFRDEVKADIMKVLDERVKEEKASYRNDPVELQKTLASIESQFVNHLTSTQSSWQKSFDDKYQSMASDIENLSLNHADEDSTALSAQLEAFKASRSEGEPITQAEFDKFIELHQGYESYLKDNWSSMKESGYDMDSLSIPDPNSLEYSLNNYISNSGLSLSDETMKHADDTIREQLGLPKDFEILFNSTPSGSMINTDSETGNQSIEFKDIFGSEYTASWDGEKMTSFSMKRLTLQ